MIWFDLIISFGFFSSINNNTKIKIAWCLGCLKVIASLVSFQGLLLNLKFIFNLAPVWVILRNNYMIMFKLCILFTVDLNAVFLLATVNHRKVKLNTVVSAILPRLLYTVDYWKFFLFHNAVGVVYHTAFWWIQILHPAP